MDYNKLRGKIVEVFRTQESFAKALGMSRVALNNKLNGRTDWTSEEIYRACNLLGIHLADNAEYFFTLKVEKSQD